MEAKGYPERFAKICRDVCARGWKRVILLGDDLREGPYTLKACLAQSGVLVLSPGEAEREWLRGIADSHQSDEETTARFAALLTDGMEHGVQAVLSTDTFFLDLVHKAGIEAPVLVLGEALA